MRYFIRTVQAVVRKELRQTFRDKRMAAILFIAPVLQLTLLGFAVDMDVDNVPTLVVDQDRSPASRDLLARMLADATFARTQEGDDPDGPMARGEVSVAVVVPRGYSEDVKKGRPAEIQVLIDGTDPVRAQSAMAGVLEFLTQESLHMATARAVAMAQASGRAVEVPMISVVPRVFYNPSLKSPIYMVPGVAAVVLLVVTTVVTAMSIAREKELGTIEQLLVTPMRPVALLLGKIIPFALLGLIAGGLVIAVGTHVFDVPVRGSVLALFLGMLLYLMSTLGTGVFISTVANNQQQAILGSFFFIMPAILLSGFMSPVENMPEWIQLISRLDPARYFVQILRAVLLKGAGVEDLAGPLLALLTFGVGILALGTLRFRKRVA
ncbi:MAG: ABC transporter permease [Myxococcales bacterium]|nr:ABC transporter permease [Myxococcales bacterium]MCB9646007.1 ABC transporter permease [Deltaproteobacteria bacterium]